MDDITKALRELPERLQRKIEVAGTCWIWTGYCDKDGYGQAWFCGASRKAHRLIYALLSGPIQDGLTIDHICRTRACVNPAHMEPVTIGVNTLRGDTLPARQVQQTQCKRGHEFTPENIYVQPGTKKRVCRQCRRLSWIDQRARAYLAHRAKEQI